MAKQKIVIRVDGSSEIGLGHISRCCALADMLKHEFEIVFYTRANAKAVIEDIKNYCTDVVQLSSTIDYDTEASTWISALNGDEIVVLDGYNFNTSYQLKIKDKGCRVACIDDIHAYHFVAEVVINHAPGIAKESYSVEPYTQLFLGTDYVLLKKIFLNEARLNKPLVNSENTEVLICLGGADPNNFTLQTLDKAVQVFNGKKINVVVGAAYLHLEELKKNIENGICANLHINVNPEEMLALMKKSHIAITSASTISLEYICVKGKLFLMCIADNQKEIYHSLIKKICAFPFENLQQNFNSNKNIYNQYKLIDGKSKERLIKLFKDL